jgi:hypothetical protein
MGEWVDRQAGGSGEGGALRRARLQAGGWAGASVCKVPEPPRLSLAHVQAPPQVSGLWRLPQVPILSAYLAVVRTPHRPACCSVS